MFLQKQTAEETIKNLVSELCEADTFPKAHLYLIMNLNYILTI